MKIVVMSDTHLYSLTEEFESICARYCEDADLVIHLGDWVSPSVLDFLEQYPLEAVAGNMDGQVIRDRLPVKRTITVGGYRIGLMHGWGPADDFRSRLRGALPDADVILFGHTHRALLLQENGVLWFNPGSVFLGRGDVPRSLGILHVDEQIRGEIVPLRA